MISVLLQAVKDKPEVFRLIFLYLVIQNEFLNNEYVDCLGGKAIKKARKKQVCILIHILVM